MLRLKLIDKTLIFTKIVNKFVYNSFGKDGLDMKKEYILGSLLVFGCWLDVNRQPKRTLRKIGKAHM